MRIIRSIDERDLSLINPVATIGNFDGVHLGHQKIFHRVKEAASSIKGTSVVITFHPHPMVVLAPEREVKLLTPLDEKLRLIETMGINVTVLIDFNRDFAKMEPEDFVKDILLQRLGIVHLLIGQNYRFGRGKRGNTELLRRLGRRYGFKVNVIRNLRINGQTVSSSRIRQLLSWGRVCEAAMLLGRAYSIHGKVIRGAGRGAEVLGIPTANISTPYEIVPREGVYAVKVRIGDELYDAVANIGKNPTFGLKEPSYEVHILDFNDNILGRDIKVYFIDRLRGERKFQGPKQLKEQILRDIETARYILKRQRVNIYP
jgi:riboflavin kinase/FMN adenylyltransferase